MEKQRPVIICMTRVKNEAWILERFLKATSEWADYILIADQHSTDESHEIYKKYPKVIVVSNTTQEYSECSGHVVLINRARKIEGPRLLIAIDADEILSPNWATTEEWNTMLQAEPGTAFEIQRINVCPDMKNMWYDDWHFIGYMDDGLEYQGKDLHSIRIPMSHDSKHVRLSDVKIIHYQFVAPERLISKHRWYQTYERVSYPKKKSVLIFRVYNYFLNPLNRTYSPFPVAWLEAFNKSHVDITSVNVDHRLWWDKEVLDYMDQYGTRYFAHLNIWGVNWCEIAQRFGRPNPEKYKDPRNKFEKAINMWLIRTQNKSNRLWVYYTEKLLNLFY